MSSTLHLTDPSIPLLKKARVSAEDSHMQTSTGLAVADLSLLSTGSQVKSKIGSLSKSGDAAWFVFDDLSCGQAEDLLRQHGDHGTYLVSHFHDPESYGLSIRVDEAENDENDDHAVYKHYAVGIANKEFHTEGIGGDFPTIESLIKAVEMRLDLKLVPIFHKFNQDTSDLEITMTDNEDEDKPPAYSQASRFPAAARKPLPLIVPVYPTLRRMMRDQQQQNVEEGGSGGRDQILESSYVSVTGAEQPTKHGCCWKTFHTDVNGKWYKPHKAGPVTGCLLVVGWVFFLVLFGWIVGLALLLVLLLIGCAGLYNFICTGRCAVEEDEEEEQGPPQMPPGGQRERGEQGTTPPS